MTEHETQPEKLDRKVFAISIICLAIVSMTMVLFPDGSRDGANTALTWLTDRLGWFYLLAGMAPIIMASWLAFGPYGDVLLGPEGEPPEYSTTSWIAMMFTASMGAGLIAWGFAEPIFYIETPPFGIEPHSDLAYEFAHMYPIYHWGIVPWAIYCLPAIPIAYMLFVDNKKSLKISDACESVLPEQGRSTWKTVIDIFVVLGVVGGVATSLGFGVPLSASLASQLLGVPDNLLTQGAVILIMTAIFGTSAYRGLKRGIKILADVNLWLMYFVMAFVVLLGPTVYILS
ncbi:MAG: BCCT family transporter, partial [Luminiphilus sp.]